LIDLTSLYPIRYNMVKNIGKGMRVVYYYDDELKYCPVKKYLAQFYITARDKTKHKKDKIDLLFRIDSKINFVLTHQGSPVSPISYPLDKNYDYFEIKERKNANTLIRIFYFRFNDLVVLLNVLEKPDHYDSSKEKRKIKKCMDETQTFYQRFKTKPHLYEEYAKETN